MSGVLKPSRRSLLGCLALVVLGFASVPAWADEPAKKAPEGKIAPATVSVVFDYGDGKEKALTGIEWRQGMTAWEATQAAARRSPPITIKHTGSGATVFVTGIDGFKNQGGGRDKRNWQFWVNGTYADAGAGTKVLQAGDKVLWKFAPPPPPGTW
ncbi:DUF4430 domain-containing protein [Cystobacter fuscus]|uniref:DUF4430 domain-containing protein n=1 Tax=Cystobacter fuscus TaxID=43 RepID=UPI0037BE3C8A